MDKVRLLNLELSDEYDFQDIKNWLAKLALEMQAGELSIFNNDVLPLNDEDALEELRNKFPDFNDDRLLQISKSQLENFLKLQL
ncbi:hypothetical protein, partial [Vallitalea maricola]|uniref:hypothetical protein n=1 Tax=Vallitalea maricola TaxID=3074433 RepID=UPI0030D7AE3A